MNSFWSPEPALQPIVVKPIEIGALDRALGRALDCHPMTIFAAIAD
jgi:hypothetical protein